MSLEPLFNLRLALSESAEHTEFRREQDMRLGVQGIGLDRLAGVALGFGRRQVEVSACDFLVEKCVPASLNIGKSEARVLRDRGLEIALGFGETLGRSLEVSRVAERELYGALLGRFRPGRADRPHDEEVAAAERRGDAVGDIRLQGQEIARGRTLPAVRPTLAPVSPSVT